MTYRKGGECMSKTILGIFQETKAVEDVIQKLEDKGLNPKDISIVMKDRKEAEKVGDNTGADVAGGALSGAATGAVVGGIAGLLAGTVLPGLGGFLIGGPIGAALGLTGAAATTVSGAATGAVAGGLIGALMGLGLSKDEAKEYEDQVKSGAILIAVPCKDTEVSFVNDVFSEYHASQVKTVTQPEDTFQSKTDQRVKADTYEDNDYQRPDQRAYATPAGAKGGKSDSNSDKGGWFGDSEGHAKAAKSRSHTKSASSRGSKGGSASSKSTNERGWHGDSKHHKEARKGKSVHK
jgi:uncharacterized membrane protein